MSQKRKDIYLGLSSRFFLLNIGVSIPRSCFWNTEHNRRQIALAPALDVSGGLDFDRDSLWCLQVKSSPLVSNTIQFDAKRTGNDEFCQNPTCSVAYQIG